MNDQSHYTKVLGGFERLPPRGDSSVNLNYDVRDYLNQACALGATSLGVVSYFQPVISMVGLDQWSAVGGIISVIGLAFVNAYSFARSTIRQHNLADAEAAKETWKGKYEAENQSNELLKRTCEDLKTALTERDSEIQHLRRQLHDYNVP